MYDPYHKWLGILPKDQPPNHYRLLNLELYEKDLEVIEGAADRAMGFIRQYQSGEHAALAAKLLNEIAAARLCLLKPKSKAEYDSKLKQQSKAVSTVDDDAPDFAFGSELQPAPKRSQNQKKRKQRSPTGLWVAGGIGVACVVLLVVVMNGGSKAPAQKDRPEQVVNNSNSTMPNQSVPTGSQDKLSPNVAAPTQKPSPTTAPVIESKYVVEPSGAPVDLIAGIDLERDTFAGTWKREGTTLIGSSRSTLYVPAKAPEDYQLKFSIKRVKDNDTLMIGFVMSGRLGTIALDAYGAALSGLYVDGRDTNANCTTRRGIVFKNDVLSQVELTVHPGHLHVVVDAQTIIDWHGSPDRLFLNSDLSPPNRESPYFVIGAGSYRIESAVMVPIKPEPVQDRVTRLDSWVDLMPLLDAERDGKKGVWALHNNVLESPETSFAQFQLPYPVPEEYSLSATVELPGGSAHDPTFVTGLIQGKSLFTIHLKNDDSLGIEKIDRLRWLDNETRLNGPFLVPRKPSQLNYTVIKSAIRMELDGRTLINWPGDSGRLSIQEDWSPVDGRKLYLGTMSYFRFRDIKIGPPTDPPRPRSQPSLQSGKPVDLLALIEPQRDALAGTWTKENGVLRAMGDAFVPKLVIPFETPSEYKLTMRVSRESGGRLDNDALDVLAPIDSNMAQITLDGYKSTICGLEIDQVHIDNPLNVSARRIQAIPPDGYHELVYTIRKTGIKVESDKKTIIDWTGNPGRLWIEPAKATPRGRIALGSFGGRFSFQKLTIESIEPTSFPPVASLGDDGNLISMINTQRDSRKAQWSSHPEGIVSPVFPGTRLAVPVKPPERYMITADVERLEGGYQLCLGMVVGGYACNAVIAGGAAGDLCGLERIDDKAFPDKCNLCLRGFQQQLLPQGKRVVLRAYVLPDSVVVTRDNQVITRWHGDPRRLSLERFYLPSNYSELDRSQLWLGTWDSKFLIRELVLKPLSDEDAAKIVEVAAGAEPGNSLVEIGMKDSAPSNVNGFSEEAAKLVIQSAKYGADDQYVDVTARVAAAAESGVLSIAVDDTLFESGETVPVVTRNISGLKLLHLQYRLNGEEKSETVEQNSVFQVDTRPTSSTKVPKGFRLIEARRGSGLYRESNWVDITKSIRTFAKKDSLTATTEELNKALKIKSTDDEAGSSKAIFIRYHFEGHEHVAIFPAGAPIYLGDVPLMPGLIMVAFAGQEFEKQRMISIESNVDVDYGDGSPGPNVPHDNFSVRWLGSINIPKTATYTFSLQNDDGARLWIDGELILENKEAGFADVEVKLAKKQHTIKVEYYERSFTGMIRLEWNSDAIPREVIPASVFYYDPKMAKQLGLK